MKPAKTCLIALFFLVGTAQLTQAQSDDPLLIRTFKGHSGDVTSVAFSPDGRYALSGSSDKTLKLWEVSTGRLIRTFKGHSKWGAWVSSVDFSPDGRYALSGSKDKTLKLWEVSTGRLIRTFTGHSKWVAEVSSVAFSPDGRYALSGSWDKTLKLWEITTGRLIRTFTGHSKRVNSVAFSPDGRYALSGSNDKTLKLWEVATGRLVRTFTGHSRAVLSVAFSPDGRYALSGSDDLKLWDVATGQLIRTFTGAVVAESVAFSPDGRYALSGSYGHTLKLWEVATGRMVRTFKGHSWAVYSVAFSPDGRYALSGAGFLDKTLKLWDVSPWTKPAKKPLAKADKTPLPKPATKPLDKADTPPPTPTKKPLVKADKTPPTIQITAPTITRGMKKAQQEKTVLVKGKATDASGIFEVLVDGQDADLDEAGNFWAEVKLRVGENRIAVKATDMRDNSASTAFTVVREAGAGPGPRPGIVEQPVEFQFGQYHALLIAVQDYADRAITDLDNPMKDAQRLKQVLMQHYTFDKENIQILANPDRRAILNVLGDMRQSLTASDNLLIFYAGHGLWDEDLQQGYWLPRNARRKDRADWISNSDIRDMIRGIKTQHTLLISDACFSGGIFKTRDAFMEPDIAISKLYEDPSRKGLTSGNLSSVPDKSIFIDYLVKRLERNTKPYLSSVELWVEIKGPVTNNSPNNQIPKWGIIAGAGDEDGDFIFVRKR